MDKIRKSVNILLDKLEYKNLIEDDYNNDYDYDEDDGDDLNIAKFVIIENILKAKTISELGLVRNLFYRIQMARSSKRGLCSKVNNLRKFFK